MSKLQPKPPPGKPLGAVNPATLALAAAEAAEWAADVAGAVLTWRELWLLDELTYSRPPYWFRACDGLREDARDLGYWLTMTGPDGPAPGGRFTAMHLEQAATLARRAETFAVLAAEWLRDQGIWTHGEAEARVGAALWTAGGDVVGQRAAGGAR